jgi:hypothetical protein
MADVGVFLSWRGDFFSKEAGIFFIAQADFFYEATAIVINGTYAEDFCWSRGSFVLFILFGLFILFILFILFVLFI